MGKTTIIAENKENKGNSVKTVMRNRRKEREVLSAILYDFHWGPDSIAFFTYENGYFNVNWALSGNYVEDRPRAYQNLSTTRATRVARLFAEAVLFITIDQKIDKLPACTLIIRESDLSL